MPDKQKGFDSGGINDSEKEEGYTAAQQKGEKAEGDRETTARTDREPEQRSGSNYTAAQQKGEKAEGDR